MIALSWIGALFSLTMSASSPSQLTNQCTSHKMNPSSSLCNNTIEKTPPLGIVTTRRDLVSTFLSFSTIALSLVVQPENSGAYDASKLVQISSPQQRLGIELTEVKIGTPSRTVVVVKSVDPFGLAAKQNVEPGVVLSNFPTPKSLIERIQNGPYPINLKFTNLAAGGDAFGDMEKPLVTAEDALNLAKRTSNDSVIPSIGASNDLGYQITTLRRSSQEKIKSRRGDVLEIEYTASYFNSEGKQIIYDTSAQRGTGLPYQTVLGSGDMLPGVDQGLYDMYPGEVRTLNIPKQLGYGDRGNKLFRIPGGARLLWSVELISVNTVREGDSRTREDMDY